MPTETIEAPVAVQPKVETQTQAKPSGIAAMRAELASRNQPQAAPIVPLPGKELEATNPAKTESPAKEAPKAKEVTSAPKVETPSTENGPLSDEAKEYLRGVTKPSGDRFMVVARKEAEKMVEKRIAEELAKLPKPDPTIAEKMTKAEERAVKLEAELQRVAIERSDKFKEEFVERPAAIHVALAELAKTYDIPTTELFAAIDSGKEGRRKVSELLETVGIVDRVEAAQLVKEYETIQQNKTKVLSDHEAALKLLEGNRTEQTKAYVQKLIADRGEALKTTVIPDIEKQYGFAFEGDSGIELKSQIMANIEKLNASDLERMEHADRAAMVSCAFMARPLADALKVSQVRVQELETQLAEFDKGTPSIGGQSIGTAKEEEPKGFIARFRAGKT